ncbi:MAG: DUF4126 domain-containing protein [Acidobacteria bacterium]|nr:DUF4126 domain-containing protein [Acidobacteriota bacterium]MCY3964048.1 DUF4126 domain-containing protein [Acidobacteriota bacterium]
MEILLSVGLGVGLAAACGFRVFLPFLVMGVAARAGALDLSQDFEWMTGTPALLAFGTAALLEIGAYYIPWLDNLLDVAAMPAAVTAGIAVAAANIETASPLLDWALAAVAGGGAAAGVQTGTTLLRGASTMMTAGIGNPVVSTGEAGAAAGLSLLAVTMPVLALAAVLLLVAVVSARLLRRRVLRARQADS